MGVYECQYCDKSFISSSKCVTHERTHTGERPYQCEYCSKSFIARGDCNRHQRIHTGEMPFHCHYCEKSFRNRYNRTVHERIHTGEKPHQCQFCNKAFRTGAECNVHERIHTGVKPFICKYCGRGFTHYSSYTVHGRIHTGDKPYQCPYCNKTFAAKRDCLTHQKSHALVKPYQCDQCTKGFVSEACFIVHKAKHKDELCHDFFSKSCELNEERVCEQNVSQLGQMEKSTERNDEEQSNCGFCGKCEYCLVSVSVEESNCLSVTKNEGESRNPSQCGDEGCNSSKLKSGFDFIKQEAVSDEELNFDLQCDNDDTSEDKLLKNPTADTLSHNDNRHSDATTGGVFIKQEFLSDEEN